MNFPVDLSLFDVAAHNPSFLDLTQSLRGATSGRHLLDYCVPVNSYFPDEAMTRELHERLPFFLKFYPPTNEKLSAILAQTLGLDPQYMVLGNGSTELITWIDRLFVKKNILTSIPTFGRWTDQPRETGKEVLTYRRLACRDYQIDTEVFLDHVRESGARVVVISNPNNPTGALLEKSAVIQLLEKLADLDLVVIDESFIEFSAVADVPTLEREVHGFENVIVLKSLGKNFGLHGVRMGYAVGSAPLVAQLKNALPPWNINGIGALLIELFAKYQAEYDRSRIHVIEDTEHLIASLASIEGLEVTPTRANFAYVQVPYSMSGKKFRDDLVSEFGCFIRECGNKLGSTSNHFRIAARPPDEIAYLTASMRELMAR